MEDLDALKEEGAGLRRGGALNLEVTGARDMVELHDSDAIPNGNVLREISGRGRESRKNGTV